MTLAGKSSRNVLRVLHDECVLVVPCFNAACLLLSCSCFHTGFQNEFLLCSYQCGLCGTSGDDQSDTTSLASWTATCQLLQYTFRLNRAAKAVEAHQHTASPKVLYLNVEHVSSSVLTVQTWRLLLHRKNVLYAGVFFS